MEKFGSEYGNRAHEYQMPSGGDNGICLPHSDWNWWIRRILWLWGIGCQCTDHSVRFYEVHLKSHRLLAKRNEIGMIIANILEDCRVLAVL